MSSLLASGMAVVQFAEHPESQELKSETVRTHELRIVGF